jgi:hypothetical protein
MSNERRFKICNILKKSDAIKIIQENLSFEELNSIIKPNFSQMINICNSMSKKELQFIIYNLKNLPNEVIEDQIKYSVLSEEKITTDKVFDNENEYDNEKSFKYEKIVKSQMPTKKNVEQKKIIEKKDYNENKSEKNIQQQNNLNENNSDKIIQQQNNLNENNSDKIIQQQNISNENKSDKNIQIQNNSNDTKTQLVLQKEPLKNQMSKSAFKEYNMILTKCNKYLDYTDLSKECQKFDLNTDMNIVYGFYTKFKKEIENSLKNERLTINNITENIELDNVVNL